MNRRKFVLSWGRKLFFGLSWPLSVLLAMVYLRAFILPESTVDLLYFVLMLFGYFGLVNTAVYFLAYCPIVLLMPTYYVSRIWSLLLILALNLFILLDALSFSNYHFHLYSFLSKLYLENGMSYLIGSQTGLIITSVATLVFAVLIWLRGEMVWRSMQGRFSNPVKNWYLVLIFMGLLSAKLLYQYTDVHPKLSEIFPFDQNFTSKVVDAHNDNRKFYYPSDALNCQGRYNPNIIFITLREWNHSQFSPETTPILTHMKRHTISYNANYNVALDTEGGMFALKYSIPSSYSSAIHETKPALVQELERRKYEIVDIGGSDDEATMQSFRTWIANRSGEEIQPYYLGVTFKGHALDVDKMIGEVILTLEKEKILSQSHVVITGAYSGEGYDTIPFLYATPDRKTFETNEITSVYDINPSLMNKIWGCKKIFKTASVGHSLETKERDWLLVTGKKDFKIIDFVNKNVTTVKDGTISDTTSNPRHELIFSALKMMTSFSKSR